MKRLIAVSAAAAIAATMGMAADEDLRAELEALKKEVQALKEQTKGIKAKKLKKQISELKSAALNDNLKWSVDFRTAYDALSYKHMSGKRVEKNDLLSNRMWLGMKYAPMSNLSFIGQLSYYKLFGQSQTATPHPTPTSPNQGYNYFDWVVGENATDGTLKVRQAYFIYFGDKFLGANVPWTASVGRRPSTDGLLVNLRDDNPAQSPLGHIINVEFDGASFKFDLSNVTDVSGMYIKLCLGRGFTNANPRFYGGGNAYVSNEDYTADNDLAGFIFVPYDDGQYSVHTTYFYSWNLLGFDNQQVATMMGMLPPGMPAATDFNLRNLGGMHGFAVSAIADGVGDGINDFLDDTILFASWAGNYTDPKDDQTMLAMAQSPDDYGKKHFGWSVYVGTQFPAVFTDDGRIGLEYNHGSQYWRSFTYGEDTMIGSKLAARGDAYEAYYTQPLLGKTLSMQLRYTYIDYEYTGSGGFFGADGAAIDNDDAYKSGMMDPVDYAQNFRAYVRYRY